MALNLSNKYPGRSNPPSIDYPEGSIKNQSAPNAMDGTPLDADWANDKEGFFQSLLSGASVPANGQVDKVGGSQFFDALKTVIRSTGPEQATESTAGVAKIATQADMSNNALDSVMATPKKLRFGFQSLFAATGYIVFPSWLGGLIIQWSGVIASNGGTSVTYPLAFPSRIFALAPGNHGGTSSYIWTNGEVSLNNRTGFVAYSSAASCQMSYIAIGY